MSEQENWTTIARVGYIGKLHERVMDSLSRFYGNSVRIAQTLDGKAISRNEALRQYEQSYYQFLKNDRQLLEWLVSTASDVYDTSPDNVNSGLDYDVGQEKLTHIQDIAIRRAVTRINLEDKGIPYEQTNLPTIEIFRGDHLVEVRGRESEGHMLNPGVVPFHRPGAILQPQRQGWWEGGSIEDYWQSNKVIQLEGRYFRSKITEDSLLPPSDTYCVGSGQLDSLVLQWCSFQSDSPDLLGIGIKQDESGTHQYFVRIIPPKHDLARYISASEYYRTLGEGHQKFDLLLRTGIQLPKGTMASVRKYAAEIEVIS